MRWIQPLKQLWWLWKFLCAFYHMRWTSIENFSPLKQAAKILWPFKNWTNFAKSGYFWRFLYFGAIFMSEYFYFDNFLSPPLLSAENIPWEESNTEKWIVWHSSRAYNSIIKNSLKFLKWRKSEVMKDNMIFGWLLDKNWQFIETISYTFKQHSQHRIKN